MTTAPHIFASTRWFDLLATSPLVLFYALAIGGYVLHTIHILQELVVRFDWLRAAEVASQIATAGFLGIQVVLFLIRTLPVQKAPGIVPRMAAIVGANLPFLFLTISRVDHGMAVKMLSFFLTASGVGASIYCVLYLGRSFSILPQARRLVTSGPYRFIRHPLYVAEQTATLGVMLQFAQPWAFLVMLASLAAQFPRMHYEEKVLGTTFPDYGAYMDRTVRLVPGIY